MTAILAHGALGNFDELIFIGIIVIFIIMMGVSWMRSLNEQEHLPDDQDKLKTKDDKDSDTDPERFRLD